MSNYRQDPTLFFMMVAVLLLVLVLVVLGLFGFTMFRSTQQPEPLAEQISSAETTTLLVATEQPTESSTEGEAAPPEPTAEPTATVEPSATPPPTAVPTLVPTPRADVLLATTERTLDCGLPTEIASTILVRDFGLDVEMLSFDSADTLFEGLENGEADLTFCFVDPEDRGQIAGEDGARLGYIRQIGSHYWDTGEGKLQIWANGAAKARMREQHPCVLQFLESIEIADGEIGANTAEEWFEANGSFADSWINCTQ